MRKKYFRYLARHFVIWTLAIAFWTIMRSFGQEVIRDAPDPTFLQQLRLHIGMGLIAGILFGSFDYLSEKTLFKKMALGRLVLIASFGYLITVLIFIAVAIQVYTRILNQTATWEIYQNFFFSQEIILLIFYTFLVGFFIDMIKQVDKKLGPGNLWRMIKGEFYHPKEDERIFMFLDLKSSTTIAEKLGHIEYSKLIQDCFKDLEVVEKYQAEVYQYVGDEAVLTWKKEIGLTNSNCLRAFFEFQEKLKKRSAYYEKKYGVIPEFKAGLNMGEIVVAEVGEIKTEIAYHGDTINTAARIQEQCNVLGKNILISERLQTNLTIETGFNTNHVGDLLLKGKSSKVNIYSVELN